MERAELAEALIASARSLERPAQEPLRPVEAEGGCGVLGAASSVPLPARALLQPLVQMRNRGNGKGGGIAAAGLAPEFFGVGPETLREDYLLAVAYLDGSPDGPWFFLVAQSAPRQRAVRLIGVTDTSMLRPQVFALQHGSVDIGVAASEKQAIDVLLESASKEDRRFWSRADRYWNARGGSHTDGGAFVFTVATSGGARPWCTDKFGRRIRACASKRPPGDARTGTLRAADPQRLARLDLEPLELFKQVRRVLPSWDYSDAGAFLDALVPTATGDEGRRRASPCSPCSWIAATPSGRCSAAPCCHPPTPA